MTISLFRSIRAAALISGCLAFIPAPAAAQTPQKDAPLTGTWSMGLIADHVVPVALVLDQKGTALTGTFIFMGKDFPVTGDVTDGKLTLKGKGPAFGVRNAHDAGTAAGAGPTAGAGPATPGSAPQLADMTITGTVDADGALAGTLAAKVGEGTGTIKWTAERLKERKLPDTQAVSSEGVSLTGAWKMTIPEAQQVMDVEFKQDGAKVTGTAKNEHLGTLNLDGMFANGTLSFVATGEAMGQQVKIEFTGKYTKTGTFAGDAASQMGALTWTAERVKKQ
jgi:hypothetical protein